MATALACLDGSAYTASVCDHAAWLAGDGVAAADLLHVLEPGENAAMELRRMESARERLEDHGAPAGRNLLARGGFEATVRREAASADIVVLGKRGLRSPAGRRGLGSNAAALVRAGEKPLCLVSQVYLPIHRGLVLIDADPSHRRAVESVADHPRLSRLNLDIVLMQPMSRDPEPKLSWARKTLGGAKANVFPMEYGTPEEAAARYMERHHADILVVSRQMLFAEDAEPRPGFEDRALWAWRTPLFIC